MASSRYPKRKRETSIADSGIGRSTKQKPGEDHTSTAPDRGRRLLPHVVDSLAAHSPEAPWISTPKTDDPAAGFEDISYKSLANAVNRAAKWLQTTKIGQQPAVLAYLGPSDARAPVLILGAIKAGHQLLMLSPRNPAQTQVDLLNQAGCGLLLCAVETKGAATEVLSGDAVSVTHKSPLEVPSIADLFDQAPADLVPYEKTFDEERQKAFFLLHTSGTTGVPKIVPITHGYYSYEDLSRTPLYGNAESIITIAPFGPGARILSVSPTWHAGGIFYNLLKPLLNEVTTIILPANLPASAELVHSCLLHSRADSLHAPPSLLADMLRDSRCRQSLEKLETIITGSGPMSQQTGDELLELNSNTLHLFGLTETDLLPLQRLKYPQRDWQYHHFHPLSGATFKPVADGLHELVIDGVRDVPQPCFEIYPSQESFATGDLWRQHPEQKQLWKHEGRVDDIIALSSGEKINPTNFEARISALPFVSGALMVGRGRRQVALMVEVAESEVTEDVIEKIWSAISSANDGMPTYGRVARNLFAMAPQLFDRTPKDTLRRRETERKLQAQILSMYSAVAADPRVPDFAGASEEHTHQLVADVYSQVLEMELHPDSDIFSTGMDSLKVAQVVRSLNNALAAAGESSTKPVTPTMLYQHRSVSGISKALHAHRTRKNGQADVQHASSPGRLLEEHLMRLPTPSQMRASNVLHDKMQHVILTGSTGSLGTHLLHALLRHVGIEHIHCFDRSPMAKSAYLQTFPKDESLIGRVTFHHVKSLNDAHFSLNETQYHALQSRVTHIIHNAWPVHFHVPLEAYSDSAESLDSHVGGVGNLTHFASTAPSKPRICFVSSLSSVLRYKDAATGIIPERIITDSTAPQNSDYARSKWMAEMVLDKAAAAGSIAKPAVIRLGQIAGPLPQSEAENGSGSVWSAKEAVPSLIMSSKAIRSLPDSLDEKDKLRWIPVNACARIILELAEHKTETHELSTVVYNVTNVADSSTEMTWSRDLVGVIKGRLEKVNPASPVEVVSLAEWICRTERYGATKDNPAVRLHDFYEELAASDDQEGLGGNIEIGRAKAASQTFRQLGSVQKDWMVHWMQGWGV